MGHGTAAHPDLCPVPLLCFDTRRAILASDLDGLQPPYLLHGRQLYLHHGAKASYLCVVSNQPYISALIYLTKLLNNHRNKPGFRTCTKWKFNCSSYVCQMKLPDQTHAMRAMLCVQAVSAKDPSLLTVPSDEITSVLGAIRHSCEIRHTVPVRTRSE